MLGLYNAYVYPYVVGLADREDEGQGLVEYALIIALIAVVVGAALIALEGRITALFDSVTF